MRIDEVDLEKRCNCASFLTNIDAFSIIFLAIEFVYCSSKELENMSKLLAMSPEIDDLTIGISLINL